MPPTRNGLSADRGLAHPLGSLRPHRRRPGIALPLDLVGAAHAPGQGLALAQRVDFRLPAHPVPPYAILCGSAVSWPRAQGDCNHAKKQSRNRCRRHGVEDRGAGRNRGRGRGYDPAVGVHEDGNPGLCPDLRPHRRAERDRGRDRRGDRVLNTHRNNFDALRFFAAASVIFSHAFLVAEGTEGNEWFARLTGGQTILGLVGVFVFFTISGYLVTGSYVSTSSA